jgi:hypothetical protein
VLCGALRSFRFYGALYNVGTFLIIAGCTWLGLAMVFVLALVGAASRRLPSPSSKLADKAAPASAQNATALDGHALERREPDGVLEA